MKRGKWCSTDFGLNHNLPFEINSIILSYLTLPNHRVITLVNRQWKRFILQYWSCLRRIEIKYTTLVPSFITIFCSCSNLLDLTLSKIPELRDEHIKQLVKWCPNINKANFSKCKQLTGLSLMMLLEDLPLESLDMSFCTNIGFEVDDIFLHEMEFISSLKMRSLDLSFTRFRGIQMQKLVKRCPLLEEFYLRRAFPSNLCPLRACTFCSRRNVKMGYCSRCRRTPYCSRVCQASDWNSSTTSHRDVCNLIQERLSCVNSDLRSLCLSCPNLKFLDLSGNRELDNYSMLLLSMSCPKLEILRIARCWRISSSGLVTISSKCKELKELHICGSTKRHQSFLSLEEKMRVIQNSENIREFCVSGTYRQFDSDFSGTISDSLVDSLTLEAAY